MAAPDEIALEFLDQLYRDVEGGWLTLFSAARDGSGDTFTDWAPNTTEGRGELAATALDRSGTCCVWFGVATRADRLDRGRRGGIDDCVCLPALFVDIDVAGPGHKVTEGLPETLDAALIMLERFPVTPTATVLTGGGVQAWWLLNEPDLIGIGDPFGDAAGLLARWGHTWQRFAEDHGYRVDSVFNVDRIMRLPGTVNRKTDEPRAVTLLEADWTRRVDVCDLDEKLLELPAPQAPPVERPAYAGAERPGDAYNAEHTAGEVLESLGFQYAKTDRNGVHYTGPWKEVRDGTSATVYADTGQAIIWSDSAVARWPRLELRTKSYDALGLLVATRFDGDFAAATRELRASGLGAPIRHDDFAFAAGLLKPADELTHVTSPGNPSQAPAEAPEGTQPSSWAPVDLAAVLADDYEAPVPTILARVDGEHLFYEGRVNALNGESGSGKSWVAILAMREELLAGRPVLMIDFEDHAESVAARLTDLGVPRDVLVELFCYVNPETPYGYDDAELIEGIVAARGITVVTIDSVGEAMALQALKQNDDDEVARWFRVLPRRLAKLGAAVILVDHVPKSKDADALHAIGSQRKRAAVDGVAYRIDEHKPLGKGREGVIRATAAKDRNGHYSKKTVVALISIDATSGTHIDAAVTVPVTGETFRPTSLMERVARELGVLNRDGVEPSKNALMAIVKGDNTAKRAAVQQLIAEGYVQVVKVKGSHCHRLIRPYVQTDDPDSDRADLLAGDDEI